MIVTRGLTKRYGTLLAVDQVDLDVREGDRYGFLGPNGSGKTTVVRMLLGLVYATSGEIAVMGQPVPQRAAEVLPSIGSLVEGPSAYGHLSGRANLALLDAAGTSGSRRTGAAGSTTLWSGSACPGSTTGRSRGTRSACASGSAWPRPCCGTPRLLILDEPTNGLDPQGIREIRDLLIELNAAGTTVFLSSHQLAEVEQLCTRIGILNQGRLVRQEDLDVLRAPTGQVIVRTPDTDRAAEAGRPGRAPRRPVWSSRPGYRRPQRPPGRLRGCASPRSARIGARWRKWCSQSPAPVLMVWPAQRPGWLGGQPGGAWGRAHETGPPAEELDQRRPVVRIAGGGRRVRRGYPPRSAARPGTRPALGGTRQRVAVPGGGAGDRAADLPANRGRSGRRRLHRGRGGLRDAQVPADPPGRPDPAAGRQARGPGRLRPDRRHPGRADRLRDRYAAFRLAADRAIRGGGLSATSVAATSLSGSG